MKKYTFFIKSIGYLYVFTTNLDSAFEQARLHCKENDEVELVEVKSWLF